MKLYIGADHNGYGLKAQLEDFLRRSGHEIVDAGDNHLNPEDDFPQYASKAVGMLLGDGNVDSRAILICGSGQGMCMAANRYKGVRASLCWNLDEARSSRNDDDSNVLCLSAKSLDTDQAKAIVTTWLHTPFAAAPRFKRRLQQLDELG